MEQEKKEEEETEERKREKLVRKRMRKETLIMNRCLDARLRVYNEQVCLTDIKCTY